MELAEKQATIQRQAEVVDVPRPEHKGRGEVLAEIRRLSLDTRHAIDPTGVDDEKILAVVNEAMLKEAVSATQGALGIKDEYNFDPKTGKPLPSLSREQVKFSDGTVLEGGIDMQSYRERLAVVKELMGEQVRKSQDKGVQLPDSDPLSGQSITPDSLAAYDATFNPDKWRTRQISKPVTIHSTPRTTSSIIQGGPVPPESGPVTIVRTQSVAVGGK